AIAGPPASPAPGGQAPRLRVVLAGGAAGAMDLELRLVDLLGEAGDVEVTRAAALDAATMLGIEAGARSHPTGWVLVADRSATVCALGAGDAGQLVCRSLEVSAPLDEVGREQIGQTLRSALLAVIDGSRPARPSAPPAAVAAGALPPPAPAASTAAIAGVSRPAATAAPARYAFNVGALYTVTYAGAGLRQAIGATASLAAAVTLRPAAWLVLQYDLPSATSGAFIKALMHGQSARGGFSVMPLRHV